MISKLEKRIKLNNKSEAYKKKLLIENREKKHTRTIT